MLKLKILTAETTRKTIHSTRNNRDYVIRQQAAIYGDEGNTELVPVGLDEDQAPYPAGEYEILPATFYFDRESGRLKAGRLALRPVDGAPSAPAQGASSATTPAGKPR